MQHTMQYCIVSIALSIAYWFDTACGIVLSTAFSIAYLTLDCIWYCSEYCLEYCI